ncbi:MAG: DUF4347 domain-containing protein [Deltaproteobacteria bacterium]|nr:DUF4347 domain-containing protein [Deltaproteobacteria bacterium]
MRWLMAVAAESPAPATMDSLRVMFPNRLLEDVQLEDLRVANTKIRASRLSVEKPYELLECTGVEDLIAKVATSAGARGPIERLDVYDHGTAGGIAIAGDLLFASDDKPGWVTPLTGLAAARALATSLAPRAEVRLLGCRTALDQTGRMLMIKLRDVFGRDTQVQGTIDRVVAAHFEEDGSFSVHSEPSLLFSAEAAVDRVAPDLKERKSNLSAISKPIMPE